jgi:hypothetical protein
MNLRRTTAALGTAALVASPVMAAAPAAAAEREFRYGGAKIEYEVDKDDGRFEVEVDIDNAKPGSKWRVTLWHDGRRYHKKVHTADREGDIEIEKNRRNTKGKDVFTMKVKRLSAAKAATRTITLR